MQRRAFSSLLFLAPLAACSGVSAPNATPLQMAKDYVSTTADAVSAAGQAFLASQPPPMPSQAALVQEIINDLQTAKRAVLAAHEPTDARDSAKQVVALIQEMLPSINAFLGGAAPYVPIAIAVIQAFINALPPPATAPRTPPAALSQKAASFKRNR